MAKRIILPGLSRSTKCSTRSCQRLDGHKGAHRGTLTAGPKVQSVALDGGVEVLSADRYTVQPEAGRKAPARKARKATAAAPRKAAQPKVVILPMAEYRRLVADSRNGQIGARRGRRAAAPRTNVLISDRL